ncbi:hypothetical protein BSL78_02954 [Apostichopus japonicus]|uniref:Uncharacterized protein n=1 Tax=Stichopus japonicus TaxID=307972 RepID=A0A2G8LIY0_STIJA|nr:hypothetical protein BSL78_02954 [Apostichopus japonicus]
MEDSIIPPPAHPFPYSYNLKKKTHLEIIERASNMSMKYADDGNRNPQVRNTVFLETSNRPCGAIFEQGKALEINAHMSIGCIHQQYHSVILPGVLCVHLYKLCKGNSFITSGIRDFRDRGISGIRELKGSGNLRDQGTSGIRELQGSGNSRDQELQGSGNFGIRELQGSGNFVDQGTSGSGNFRDRELRDQGTSGIREL